MSDRSQLERRIAELTAELETAKADLETLDHTVSHDLRAPLRAISGFCALICAQHASELSAEAQRKIDVVKNEAARMGTLIDGLLAFARLGRATLHPQSLAMTDVARSAFEHASLEHGRRDVNFRLPALPSAPADPSLLQQAWICLLANALKFTSQRPQPTIEVSGALEEGQVHYRVRDNGAGFDPHYADKLFQIFQRLHADAEFPGTGVGLALVERIVTRHGGRVWAEGSLGAGAVFHFTLPAE